MAVLILVLSSLWETAYEAVVQFYYPRGMGSWGMRHSFSRNQGGPGLSISERHPSDGPDRPLQRGRHPVLTRSMLQHRFQEKNTIQAQNTLMETMRSGLPVDPVMNKAFEGMAKNKPDETIVQAMKKTQSRYAYAYRKAQEITTDEDSQNILGRSIAQGNSDSSNGSNAGQSGADQGNGNNGNDNNGSESGNASESAGGSGSGSDNSAGDGSDGAEGSEGSGGSDGSDGSGGNR